MPQNQCTIQRSSTGRIISVDTDDFDEFRQQAPGWKIDHQLTGTRPRHSALHVAITPSLQFGLVQHAMGYCSQGQNPTGALTLVTPCNPAQPMIYRGRRIDSMALLRSNVEFELFCGSGAQFFVASFLKERVERFAADVWQVPKLGKLIVDQICFINEAYRELCLVALTRLFTAVKVYPALLNSQIAIALFEEKILESLLLKSYIYPFFPAEASRRQVARLAYRYLRDHIDEVPSIRDLCTVTRASYATVERAFREMYGITPKIMLNEMRLSKVRTALLHPDSSTTVTEVALRWGFVELGRFSAYYRQRYNETPSETLHSARGIPVIPEDHLIDDNWPPGPPA